MNEPAICAKLRAIRVQLQLTLEAVEEALEAEGCNPIDPPEETEVE